MSEVEISSLERRFVILEHDHPWLHWDLMIEADGVLRTWRLPRVPAEGFMDVEALADHRLTYLDYEGPVSGQRGVVKRWDVGTYQMEFETDGEWRGQLTGAKFRAEVRIWRGEVNAWQCQWVFGN